MAKKITEILIAAVLAMFGLVVTTGVYIVASNNKAAAVELESDWTWKVYPSDKTNTGALLRMKMDKIGEKVLAIIEEYEAQKAAEEQAAWEAEQAAYYYEPVYYSGYSYGGVSGDPNGLNSFVGVVDGLNGTIETAYSSNVLYHYRTSEWTPDEYGFYRTSDGYYVVASNEYEEGTVIETSRGEAMVLDGGCAEGYIDFYVNW